MAKESREITMISTLTGHYQQLRMPFSLKSAPLTFQGMVNTLFAGMLGNSINAYLVDVIISSKSVESHLHTEFNFPAIARSQSSSKTVKIRVFEVQNNFFYMMLIVRAFTQ